MKLMRISFAAMLIFALHYIAHASQEIATPKYSITVSTQGGPVRLGQPIIVTVTVKNISNQPIDWQAETGNTAYKAFNFSFKGKNEETPKTAFHRMLRGEQSLNDPAEMRSGSSVVSQLMPGKTFDLIVDLTKLYDIENPGVYTLDLQRIENDNKTVVRSNTLTMTIEP